MSGEGEAPERPRLQTASHGSVIATRDPKAVLRSGLVSGLGGWLLPTAAPSRGRSQWPDAAAKPSLPLRGQRRPLTGFPIIRPAWQAERHHKPCDRSEEHTSELQSLMRT